MDRQTFQLFKLIFWSIIFIVVIYYGLNYLLGGSNAFVFKHDQPQINQSTSLKEVVSNTLAGTKGNYAIAIKNLKTNESYYQDEQTEYETGSLYKLWIMATAYQEIENQSLNESQILTSSIADLNKTFDIPDDQAELTEGSITLSVADALKQMITISHNYSALLLTEELKLSTVKSWLQTHQFKNSLVGVDGNAPTTTALDIAIFFEKLYRGELGSTETTVKMVNLLKAQQLNDKIPRYLPDEVEIAHKTGEIGFFSHDGGIIYTPKGDYLLVVLSKSDSPDGADERIAKLSKTVYDYFNSN